MLPYESSLSNAGVLSQLLLFFIYLRERALSESHFKLLQLKCWFHEIDCVMIVATGAA